MDVAAVQTARLFNAVICQKLHTSANRIRETRIMACRGSACSSSVEAFDPSYSEARHATEVAHVERCHLEIVRKCGGGNLQVVSANGLPCLLQTHQKFGRHTCC